MEMAGSEVVNMPKSYSLNMSKDFVPMGVFSESSTQGDFLPNLTYLYCFPFPSLIGGLWMLLGLESLL